MPKSKPLSSTAQAVLEAAAQRDDRHAFPPGRLPAAAKRAVGQSLIKAGLLEEIAAEELGPVWRVSTDGERFALRATEAGLAAVGIVPTRMPQTPTPNAVEVATASASQDEPSAEPMAAEAEQAARGCGPSAVHCDSNCDSNFFKASGGGWADRVNRPSYIDQVRWLVCEPEVLYSLNSPESYCILLQRVQSDTV